MPRRVTERDIRRLNKVTRSLIHVDGKVFVAVFDHTLGHPEYEARVTILLHSTVEK